MADRDRPACPAISGFRCPMVPCPGSRYVGACSQLALLAERRGLSVDQQLAKLGPPRPAVDPAVRDAVNACPDRGPVLPISMQDDCGCRGKELSECRSGKGAIPGRVTLRDCLSCRGEALKP